MKLFAQWPVGHTHAMPMNTAIIQFIAEQSLGVGFVEIDAIAASEKENNDVVADGHLIFKNVGTKQTCARTPEMNSRSCLRCSFV